jgi:hypothetical protein
MVEGRRGAEEGERHIQHGRAAAPAPSKCEAVLRLDHLGVVVVEVHLVVVDVVVW